MSKSFGSYLKRIAPQEMTDFFQRPWDYVVHGPLSTEDEAVIVVHLEYGLTKCEKIVELTIDLATHQVTKNEVVNA